MSKKIFLFFGLINIFSPVEVDQIISNLEAQNTENHSMEWAPFYDEEFISGKFHFKYNQKLQKAYEDKKTSIKVKEDDSYKEVLYFLLPNLNFLYNLFNANSDLKLSFYDDETVDKIAENLIAFHYLNNNFFLKISILSIYFNVAYHNHTLIEFLKGKEKRLQDLILTEKVVNKNLKEKPYAYEYLKKFNEVISERN